MSQRNNPTVWLAIGVYARMCSVTNRRTAARARIASGIERGRGDDQNRDAAQLDTFEAQAVVGDQLLLDDVLAVLELLAEGRDPRRPRQVGVEERGDGEGGHVLEEFLRFGAQRGGLFRGGGAGHGRSLSWWSTDAGVTSQEV
jgi:hypothetical protein